MEGLYAFYNGKRTLILGEWDRPHHLDLPVLETDVLVLCGNPGITIPCIQKLFNPSVVVVDSSNSIGYAAGMESACREAGIRFHSTRTGGCFEY
jgi:hypothetical protein